MKYIIFLAMLFYFDLNGASISEALEEIPNEHLQNIKYLFDQVFLQQDGAYTIFGDKPVSTAASFLIPSWETTLTGYPGKLPKSWETWQMYKHKFPMKKYLLVSERKSNKKSGSVAIYIYVINKKEFVDTINNHLSLFEATLHQKIEPLKLLDDIETGKSSLLTSINHNEMLFGILLGYGEHNAALYAKSRLSRNAPILFPEKVKLDSSDEYYPMMIVNPVQFMADLDHPETTNLQQKYMNLRKEIALIYSKDSCLEITLSQLTSR